jgi:uncharacterized protein (TIGR03083 family)
VRWHDGAVLEQTAVLDALDAVYGQLTDTVRELGAAELMLPSRCAGWVAGDVLYHQLMDARRALRTFASPDPGPADRDDVTYWQAYAPGGGAQAADAAYARHVRIAAAAYAPDELIWEWTETAAAARRAARACRAAGVATQGYVLTPADFTATLVVEAAVHYLDLTVHLPAAPPPAPAALALVRRVLDGLAGQPLPASWDDVSCALKGTGRVPLDSADRAELGALAGRLPAFV